MRTRLSLAAFGLLAVTLIAGDKPTAALPPAVKGDIDFAKDVQPIFARACLKCHNGAKERGGLRLDDNKAALAGGNSGVVIVPGAKAADSKLLHAVAGIDPDLKMPPEGPALTATEVGTLRAWIEHGAKWSGGAKTAVAHASGSGSMHWAFIAPKRPTVPTVSDPGWVRTPIDAFILAKLDTEKVAPSPEADRPTLLRRVTLDLTGLPPTLGEVDAFVNDPSPDAYIKVVRRLLASPAYGERWGRHWLDNARYADSDGFEKDTGRPWAWRYRQWVIDALNRDLPFDRFAVEQLAGDQLPGAGEPQYLATGFHRNTLTNKEGGVDQEQFRVEQVVDRVNTTGKVFLGLTVGCCQCHDHKYDPLSQREYYQLFAFFNADREVDREIPQPGEEPEYRAKKAAHDRKQAQLKKALEEHKKALPDLQAKWEAGLTLPQLRPLPADVQQALLKDPKVRTDKDAKTIATHFAREDAETKKRQKAVTDHAKTAPTLSKAQTLMAGPARTTRVMLRGDFLRPGAEVKPGTPAILPPLPAQSPPVATGGTPTRLDLANWIVAPDNPLTGRVLVNWVWHKFFGRGIVPTLEDFGTQGEKASHPELLDWLATEVVQRGWSLKQLHELIVTSAVYRQSSAARPELRDRDALNVWLARQNRLRLEAESMRDAALAVGGLLAPRIGGPSVRPPQPAGISELTYANAAKWTASTGADRYRRGIYTWFQRTSPHPMLMTFDAPDSNVCCVRRERSNTPLQALTLLNDASFVECAQGLARQSDGSMSRLVKLALGREPTAAELSRLDGLRRELTMLAEASPTEAAKLAGSPSAGQTQAEAAGWVGVARAVLNLDEFMTRE
ncbi:MAG: PSD1 and planctomycete cytochrome C domain-containing protein [Gemmataceae bacterium]